jgi:hypothetical protein
MKKMLAPLNQPYPYYNTPDKILKNTILVFLFVFLFLYLFTPFHVNEAEHKFRYSFICIVHALNASIIYCLFFLLFNRVTNMTVNEQKWKVYNVISITGILFLFIGFGSFLLRPLIYTTPNNFSWRYFRAETINTFLAGTLVFAAFTLIDYYRLVKINRGRASVFEEGLATSTEKDTKTTTADENNCLTITVENEPLELNISEFLFAKADGNYTTFYFNRDRSLEKLLKRTSLKNIEDQLSGQPLVLIKTHRSFIVNTMHVRKIEGNAQGYQLYFAGVDFAVPVSRGLIPAFNNVMNGNKPVSHT